MDNVNDLIWMIVQGDGEVEAIIPKEPSWKDESGWSKGIRIVKLML
jgi:hypothetical protein